MLRCLWISWTQIATSSKTITDTQNCSHVLWWSISTPNRNIGIQGRVTWITKHALLMISVQLFPFRMKPLMPIRTISQVMSVEFKSCYCSMYLGINCIQNMSELDASSFVKVTRMWFVRAKSSGSVITFGVVSKVSIKWSISTFLSCNACRKIFWFWYFFKFDPK